MAVFPSPIALMVPIVLGYVLGSIPSGLLIGRWLAGVDIRRYGSGRTGATNAMRSLGARGFALTFAADAGKAVAAVLIARALFQDAAWPGLPEVLAGIAAIVGHNWSLFIGFAGGRGVSSSFGALLALYWPGALLGLAVFGVLVAATRYVSLGSIVGTLAGLAVSIVAVVTGLVPESLAAYACVAAVLVVVQHRDNIQRLFAGTERKIGERAKTAEQG